MLYLGSSFVPQPRQTVHMKEFSVCTNHPVAIVCQH